MDWSCYYIEPLLESVRSSEIPRSPPMSSLLSKSGRAESVVHFEVVTPRMWTYSAVMQELFPVFSAKDISPNEKRL
jgi:hypothetical protein